MEHTALKLPSNIPLLMVVSDQENPNIRTVEDKVFSAIKGDKKKLVEVGAPHRQVPGAAKEQVAEWLETFKSR